MQPSTKSDHLLMSLVERVLARPKEERQVYLENECGNDTQLFSQAWTYVRAEERMGSFLLDPLASPAECDPPLEPGQLLLDRFRIIREVARGGMGIVWEARDEKMDLRVALKCAKAGFGKQLPPEVRNARDISHPNVCNIFEIHTVRGPHGDFDFISMEFLEGETLSERLRGAPLSKQEGLTIALQLCAGLAEAHRNNVTHGDLKSNNIILTTEANGSFQAVIMDFGLARRQTNPGQLSPIEVLAGTPAYMAPELWRGVKPSTTSDIYALGVVLWELVSGKRPGDIATASTLPLSQRHAWKIPAWHGRWDRIIARCLEEDPAKRFQNADEVAHALGPPRTTRWLLTTAAAALLAAVSGLITYQRVTAPSETVRLALLPFASSGVSAAVPENILRETANRLVKLKGGSHTKFTFIPRDKALGAHADTADKARVALGATHVLQGEIEQKPGAITIHAYVTDLHSGAALKEWTGDYHLAEVRYAPAALASVVTNALHLPLTEVPTVNAEARADYLAGVSAVRRPSGADAALAYFTRSVAADSDSPLTYAGLADAQLFKYYKTRDKEWLNRTAESFRQAENRNPDLPQVHRISGWLKAYAGSYEQAKADYLRAIELEPGNGDAYLRLGQAYWNNNQLGEALASFRKATEVDPQGYRNFEELGAFYYRRANYAEAVKQFRQAATLAPGEARIHYDLGAAELDAGHLTAAENEFGISVHLQESADALEALGMVLMYQRKEEQAIPFFTKALTLNQQRYLGRLNLGIAYRLAGRPLDAEREYRLGLDLAQAELAKKPSDGRVRAGLAYLCSQLGDRRRAEFEVAQALRQSPNDSDTHAMAARTYEALGPEYRNETIALLTISPAGVLADLSRWPEVADLQKDSRFLQLLASHSEK
jgi:tetratricopeptide (TPR) repeat protein